MLLSIQTGYAGTEGGNTECAVGSRGESRPGIPKTTRARREDELGAGSYFGVSSRPQLAFGSDTKEECALGFHIFCITKTPCYARARDGEKLTSRNLVSYWR